MLRMESISHWGLFWYKTSSVDNYSKTHKCKRAEIRYEELPQNSVSFNDALRLVRYINGEVCK